MSEGVRIRPASPADRDFVVSLVPRLVEFGPPSWRDPAQMTDFDTHIIVNNLLNPRPGVAVFIAEDEGGAPLGLVHLQTETDFYTGEEHGHVTDLIIAAGAEGRGVGAALLRKAEGWTRERGHRLLTLHVFERNTRARELYERQGFIGDMFKYVKPLD